MNKDEATTKLTDAINKLKAMAFLGYEIPNELNKELDKLVSDYNEALKKEKGTPYINDSEQYDLDHNNSDESWGIK